MHLHGGGPGYHERRLPFHDDGDTIRGQDLGRQRSWLVPAEEDDDARGDSALDDCNDSSSEDSSDEEAHPDEEEGARLVGELTGHAEAVTAVKWCEWRELWVTASNDRTFRLWCPRALETTRCLKFRGDSITAMALDASNGKVLAAMTDRKVRVFDLARMEGRKDKHGNWIDDGVKGDDGLDGGEGDQDAEGEKKATEAEEDAPAAPEGKEQSKVEEPPAPRVPNFAGARVDDDADRHVDDDEAAEEDPQNEE